jgi:hypothetical protein
MRGEESARKHSSGGSATDGWGGVASNTPAPAAQKSSFRANCIELLSAIVVVVRAAVGERMCAFGPAPRPAFHDLEGRSRSTRATPKVPGHEASRVAVSSGSAALQRVRPPH